MSRLCRKRSPFSLEMDDHSVTHESIPSQPRRATREESAGTERRMRSPRVLGYSLLITVILHLTLWPCQVSSSLFRGQCPEQWCTCGLDSKGRMEVKCSQGRMRDVPVMMINPSVEVIKIVPPPDQKNHLTIGGFFRKFKKLEELHIVSELEFS